MVPSGENRSLLLWAEEAMQQVIVASLFENRAHHPLQMYARGKTHVGAAVVVDGSLGQHGVVFQLGLAERRRVASNQDQLSLARSEGC